MRIVGGKLRGRKLAVPKSQNIRPTTDRNRESLFNILTHAWPEKLNGTHVLDLFAGTGALGCEALSRGANAAVFIETSSEGRGLIRENIEAFGLTGNTKLFRRDATKPGPIGTLNKFDLIFADPPYGKGLGQLASASLVRENWLNPGALLVLEEQKNALPTALDGFRAADRRQMGETAIGFFEFVASN